MRDQWSWRHPQLTALAQFFQGALVLEQLSLRLPKLGARGLQLCLRPQAWEEGGDGAGQLRPGILATALSPARETRLQAPPPQPTCLTAAIADSDLLHQGSQRRRLLRGWNDPRPPPHTPGHPRGLTGHPSPPGGAARGPASGTLGYPLTHGPRSPGSALTVCFQQVLTAQQRPALRGGCEEKFLKAPSRGLLNSPLPGECGARVWGPIEGTGRGTAHMMCPCAEGRQAHHALTFLRAHTHTCGVYTDCSHVFTLSPRQGSGTPLVGPLAEGRAILGVGEGWDTISPSYRVTHPWKVGCSE